MKDLKYKHRALLEVKNFTFSFSNNPHQKVVDLIDFSLYPNEFIGIIGESGSGKSVTAKAILQLNSPNGKAFEGSKIIYGNQNLLTLSEESIRKIRGREISIVFQDPMTYLNPTAPIGKQIEESIRLHFPHTTSSESYLKTLEYLRLVELDDQKRIYKKYPHELSGGMRQRVMIAIALAPNPRIFIADEITTALDVTIQHEILLLLKKLQKTLAMSVIFITHDLSIVSNFADRIIVMYKGKIVETGNSEDVCKKPLHPYTQALIDSTPTMEMDKNSYLATIEILRDPPPSGCPFYNRCTFAQHRCKILPPLKKMGSNNEVLCHFPLIEKKEVTLC
jgi:oligopeptide/dipeptide ABC transporter ATP-binding protein